VFLNLELDQDGKVIVTRESTNTDERLAGQIEEKELSNCSSLEDLQVIKELLQKGEELECKVTSCSGQAYFITLTVSADVINKCHTEVAKVAIDEIKQELIAKGFKEETLTEIEDYLLENNFSAMEIQQLFGNYKVYPEDVQFRIVERPKTIFHDDFGALKIAFASMLNSYHVLCSGDKGTGKNCFIETWAWITQRPLYSISINRDTDKLDLMGSRTIDANIDDNGNVINKIAFSPEVMLEAMEVGGIINIDEINFADPGVTGLLHSICDDRRAIEVPGFRKVKADDNFCVMGTMNIDYQGTNEMNEALTDRFIDIMFPANISIFDVLVRACPDTPESEVQKADRIYQKMYSIIQDRDSSLDSSCLTVRGFIQGLQLSKVLGLKEALKVCVANKVKDDEYRSNIVNIIENII
jgi:midasin (ATPase involved in ribosome maturation)